MNTNAKYPTPHNEPIYAYYKDNEHGRKLRDAVKAMRADEREIPMIIDGQPVTTNDRRRLAPPHDHKHTLGHAHFGTGDHVRQAIDAALKAKHAWQRTTPDQRAAIFLKAADLAAGPFRYKLNAATMLGQSKTAFQAEIDAACEFIDFLRFNVQYMRELYGIQPDSAPGMWNRLDYRPLEGFVFALTPFNFTAIAGNLPSAPALMGNTVVWKPADTQIYAAAVLMEIFMEAGLPPGVINLVFADGPAVGDVVFKHRDFAGLHFTGSTAVFKHLWRTIAENLDTYRAYPRIVGETGGKDFILAHPSADPLAVATGMTRGAYEFQGQKCSAASRAYIPQSLAGQILERVVADIKDMKKGSPEELDTFFSAVIDEKSFDKIAGFIEEARQDPAAEILAGGGCNKSKGYFVEPTLIRTTNPMIRCICEEIFGPVLTVYVYDDEKWPEMFKLVDETSEYALTGAVFARDAYAAAAATEALRHSAGNFYINDKPTGAVVNQQPFGGGRGSGTNDKAGSIFNLIRWVSPRNIKETFVSPTAYRYPWNE